MFGVDEEFTRALPKCELHAHLTGSISRECLHDIWVRKRSKNPDVGVDDPLIALSGGQSHYDINTFFPLFSKYIYMLVNDIESVQQSTHSIITSFMDDGVCYLELRTTPRSSTVMSQDDYVSTVLDAIERFSVPTEPSLNEPSKAIQSISVFLILSIDRRMTPEEAMNVVELAIRYKTRTPHGRSRRQGVVGIDLCGDPSKPCEVSKFRAPFSKAKENGLKISLHFAEVQASSSSGELRTLLSFNPDRLGHVIHVNESSRVEIENRKLALELCLSCNVHAKMINGGFEAHHFKHWRQKKDRGPIALSTDDVGVFLSLLSNEYLIASQHFGLSRNDLLDLCEEASEAIFVEEERAGIKQRIGEARELSRLQAVPKKVAVNADTSSR